MRHVHLAIALAGFFACQKPAPVATASLPPWEPVSESFRGCEAGCGERLDADPATVAVQPGAHVGDQAFCPVSGVAFQVHEGSPHREVGGQTYYFCCDSCADYFTANQVAVLAARAH